jgi:hypothetical protein
MVSAFIFFSPSVDFIGDNICRVAVQQIKEEQRLFFLFLENILSPFLCLRKSPSTLPGPRGDLILAEDLWKIKRDMRL